MDDNIHYKEIYELGIPIIIALRKRKRDFGFYLKLYKIFKDIKPDIVHTWDYMTSFYSIPFKYIFKAKLIDGSIRWAPNWNILPFFSKFFYKFNFLFADKLISNSRAGVFSLNAPKKKAIVIWNGFDFNRISNLENKELTKQKFDIASQYIVGMIGRFAIGKDWENYIKLAQRILEIRNDITFLAIGDGYESDRIKSLVKKENQNSIIFTGNQNDVESIINILDIGILLSNNLFHGEGISNVIMEYMALSKPVIASVNGGNDEIILNDVTGFLIDQRNTTALEEKLIYLIENENIRLEMGNKCKERMQNIFSLDKMIHKYQEVYNNII
jgi:glycosyltransferase involved in cell wall biosynthesis